MLLKNILVTGGAGYIGSHACKALAHAGYNPVAYDNMIYGHEWAVKWGPLEVGDVLDYVRLDEVLAKYRPSAVMHFAAYAYVGESVENPGKYYRNNVAGTLSLLEAMRDHGIDMMVFSSSCATYGVPQTNPITEEHPQSPINPYGMSKLMVEQILKDCATAHDLRYVALRYFNAAGADPGAEIGEQHDPETHLIPLVLEVVSGKREYITVFGDDYDTPDGTCVRDYIHVSDLAKAHVLALQELERLGMKTDPAGDYPTARIYNLGNGQGFSVKEVIEVAERVTGKAIPIKVGARRLGDPPVLVGDATKIRRELSWQPRYNDLETIIETACRWTRKMERSNR